MGDIGGIFPKRRYKQYRSGKWIYLAEIDIGMLFFISGGAVTVKGEKIEV